MDSKKFIYFCLFVGSTIGGMIPMLWDSSPFSLASVFLSGAGGIAGIVVGYKLSN